MAGPSAIGASMSTSGSSRRIRTWSRRRSCRTMRWAITLRPWVSTFAEGDLLPEKFRERRLCRRSTVPGTASRAAATRWSSCHSATASRRASRWMSSPASSTADNEALWPAGRCRDGRGRRLAGRGRCRQHDRCPGAVDACSNDAPQAPNPGLRRDAIQGCRQQFVEAPRHVGDGLRLVMAIDDGAGILVIRQRAVLKNLRSLAPVNQPFDMPSMAIS